MFDLNKAFLTGRVGTDIELKTTAGGTPVCSFRLAVDRPKSQNEPNQQTDWLDCVAWRQQAEFMARYVSKGDKILMEAYIRTREWEARDGSPRRTVEFHAVNITPAGNKGEPS